MVNVKVQVQARVQAQVLFEVTYNDDILRRLVHVKTYMLKHVRFAMRGEGLY